jgi:hypothetical protein
MENARILEVTRDKKVPVGEGMSETPFGFGLMPLHWNG